MQDSLRLFGKDSGKNITGVVISSNYTLGVERPADPSVAVYLPGTGSRSASRSTAIGPMTQATPAQFPPGFETKVE